MADHAHSNLLTLSVFASTLLVSLHLCKLKKSYFFSPCPLFPLSLQEIPRLLQEIAHLFARKVVFSHYY